MRNLKCPSCGAPIRGTEETQCEFCGAYLVEEEHTTEFSDRMKNIGNNIMDSFENISEKISYETQKTHIDSNFNWFLFFVLFFVVPPVAIIYLIFNLIGAKR
ncbi:MAG: hypothetical protein IJW82_07960 [Clostridia bacterium]|nr:hypothetical protein [Clostridia bacterium]